MASFLPLRAGLILGLSCLLLGLAEAGKAVGQDRPEGITEPIVFAPFDPGAPGCAVPPGLKKILAFAQDNRREFMEGVSAGLAKAADDRQLDYQVMLADNDARKMIEQVQTLFEAKVGAVVAAPVDPASLSPALKEIIWEGGYVGTIVPPPATTLLNAPQYLTGKALGDVAAAYINTQLKGKANVVLLTHDNLQFLAPRFVAMRDSLKGMPGVNIVADVSPATVDNEGGFSTMNLILLAHPDVDVVLGADTVVLGALKALRAAGKDRPDQFLGGIDGEPDAVEELKKDGSPYKASISLASPVFAYAMGQFAADWLEGKSVPQAMDILPSTLTKENIANYEADIADPAAVFHDPVKRESYLRMYGNICYDTRDRYVNFPWSSEAK